MGKLKRFLLRYDPPGIGLEIEEEEGTVDVLHKSLPAASEVSSVKEIKSLVDKLIDGEEILTKRRHHPALMQLLGRLYKVEVDATDDEAVDSPSSPAASGDGGLQEGQQVVLINLKGKLQVHNGELGTVTKAKKDKFEVLISSGRSTSEADTLKVKGSEHLVPIVPKGTLSVGTHVAIRGLRNHVELNGCVGRVVECYEESHRFEVRATESGQLFRVKQENLVPIEYHSSSKENREPNVQSTPRLKKEAGGGSSTSAAAGVAAQGSAASIPAPGEGIDEVFEPGSQVQLVGLKTAMCFNGHTAEVLSVDRVRCRYEIRLTDGSVKTIRAENVKLVSGAQPSKASPRTRRQKEGNAAAAGQPADRKMR